MSSIKDTHDIVVVSDLHIGRGYIENHSKYSRQEEFFYDKEFYRFIEKLIGLSNEEKKKKILVLNGDIFDFLSVTEIPDNEELENMGIEIGSSERKYGLGSSEKKAVWKMKMIIEGHPVFFESLALFLKDGHEIVYIRGNHDLEMYWKSVRQLLKDHISSLLIKLKSESGDEISNFKIKPWFYTYKDELYIEHGHQYDETNAITGILNPLLPEGSYNLKERLLDYPIGSLFARFVYSPIRSVDPYRVHVISFTQYLSVIRGFDLWEFVKTVHLNFPFFVRAVRNATSFSKEGLNEIMEKHVSRRERYAKEHDISNEKLKKLDNLRARPLGHSTYDIFLETFKPIIKKIINISILSVLSILGWIFIFTAFSSILSNSILGLASVVSVLAVLTVAGLFFLLTKIGNAIEKYEDPLVAATRDAAEKVSEVTGIKNVVMGHTHVIEKTKLKSGGYYINSGTWILFPGKWDNLQIQSRQFTFAYYKDGDLKILKWDPYLNDFVKPLVLIE